MNRDHTASAVDHPVRLPIGLAALEGHLTIPTGALGIVLFAHGSGSSRHSPRNQWVARQLQTARLGTLLIDLLTPDEDRIDQSTRQYRFDIPRLAARLVTALDWLRANPETSAFSVGLFGASTGAGAALIAAAERPSLARAVVSRGGRPDLAGAALPRVTAPTLLIVGGFDEPVIELNQAAMRQMRAVTRMEIVPGATHLFEEPGTLQQVATLAAGWFRQYLSDQNR